MRLNTVQIQDFRCIEDSGEFTIADVTCLVGKNESGKTALLKALAKLNAVADADADFVPLDYPRRKWRPDEPIPATPVALTTTWELTGDEFQKVEVEFGPGCLKGGSVVITKGYDNIRLVQPAVDEANIAQHLIQSANLSEHDLAALEGPFDTVAAARDRLANLADATDRHVALLKEIDKTHPNGPTTSIGAYIEREFLPKFIYFNEYYTLPGAVSIDDYVNRKSNKQLRRPDLVFSALMALAGTTPEEIQKIGKFEELNAALRAISNQISEEVFEYWSQNRHLDALLRFDAARPGDPPPLNTGYVFRTRIDNRRHKNDTSFDERSSGFVWFFSFLVWFSQLRSRYGRLLVVLLDEPGLTLHARAQADLLRYINERLRPSYQVIYTTHSPFMIDPDNLLSARTVEDVVTKDDRPLGTKVGDRVLSTDPDTISPLQKALDYEITQTLFVGRHTLLVEGPSDLAYLKWFSSHLAKRGRTALDYRWTICRVGGVDRIPGFVSLFQGNSLHVAAVVDYHEGIKRKLETARKVLGANHLLTLEQYARQEEADIEDVLGREFYVALVNRAYDLFPPRQAPTVKPHDAPQRVVKEVEAHFAVLPPQLEEFDHFKPARWLLEAHDEGTKLPGFEGAMDRMEEIMTALNALLPS